MKRILAPLIFLAAILPLTATAALVHLEESPDTLPAPAVPKITAVDLLNDPQPFKMNPEGSELTSFDRLHLTKFGNALLYVAKTGDKKEKKQAEMIKKVEAKIKELKRAGKKDQAEAVSKKLAEIKKKANHTDNAITEHKDHDHAKPHGDKKMEHMRAALKHLRAAGADEIADKIEKGLRSDAKSANKPCPDSDCPDCKKGGKGCPECDKAKGCPECDKAKGCPECRKDGKACPKCETGETCPDAKKADKPCPEGGCPGCKKDGKACPKCEGAKIKAASQAVDPAKLREHLQARDARVGKAIGELQNQIKDLRKQVGQLRADVEKSAKGSKKAEPKRNERKRKPRQEKKKNKKTSSSTSIIEV